ncbi:hypothetical protein SteCoe_13113 [Stentor coeruleus]|uniref:Adenosine deaminase domain-containing protein n=1 Tax=Stentor coeruleus TaxID=5963 RepID=A0A1R2C985_9CILI|nr:hypothetical protein SteCoe_13113 [Stentor coeruleus]
MDCKNLPKIELHAHINGCLRRSTLHEFLQEDNKEYQIPAVIGIKEAFEIFSWVHSVMTTKARLQRVVEEILEDFENQNCLYIELRTTPKSTKFMSKQEYLSTIVSVFTSNSRKIKAKLLISINRSQSLEEAWENLHLAQTCEKCVGLDFSGNPMANKFNYYVEVFNEARKSGLKITVHTAEIEDEEDTVDILNFRPDRIGHCNYLSERCENLVKDLRIPMEICPSSNMATIGLGSMVDHHFGKFYGFDHPIAICTDDTLLFDTDISKEYELVANAYSLGDEDLKKIVKNSAEMAFSDEALEGLS